MIQTINKSQFHTAFHQCGRGKQFSYEGLNELYDYLENLESDMGEPIELDVIALCCDYAEDNVYNVLAQYNLETIEELENKTMVVWHDQENAIVLYQQF